MTHLTALSLTLVSSLTLVCSSPSQAADAPKWYKGPSCKSLNISEFRKLSDPKPSREKNITDGKFIKRFLSILDQLPTSGALTKKPDARTSLLQIIANCDGGASTLRFYSGQIQTPATTFYSSPSPTEDELYVFSRHALD